jgi:hypothetical protein
VADRDRLGEPRDVLVADLLVDDRREQARGELGVVRLLDDEAGAVRIDRSSSSRVVAPSASAEMVRVATRIGSTPSRPSEARAMALTILLTSTGSSSPLRFLTRMPDIVVVDASTHVREFGLSAQLRPHLVDRFGRGVHEIDHRIRRRRARGLLRPVAFGLGVPDLLHLEQSTVSSPHVVLAKLEGGPPSGTLEFATFRLLQDRAVLALACQALPRRGKGSGDHGCHLERRSLWSVSPDCCEFLLLEGWGQPPNCVPAVGAARIRPRLTRRADADDPQKPGMRSWQASAASTNAGSVGSSSVEQARRSDRRGDRRR